MPIKPENRSLYPKDWKQISLRIREDRAQWHCEMADCAAEHGKPHPITGSKVVLTVMHLDHDPRNNGEANLLAACQRCHNLYDQKHRQANATITRHEKVGQLDMFRQAINKHAAMEEFMAEQDELIEALAKR